MGSQHFSHGKAPHELRERGGKIVDATLTGKSGERTIRIMCQVETQEGRQGKSTGEAMGNSEARRERIE